MSICWEERVEGSDETGQLGGRDWISSFASLVGFFLLFVFVFLFLFLFFEEEEDFWMEIGIFVLEEEDCFALLLVPFAILNFMNL